MTMKTLLLITSIIEAATGLALMATPAIVARLLLRADGSGVVDTLGRVAGVGLLSLGLACWPSREANSAPALRAMLTYNLLMTIYLVYLGVGGDWVGRLLWPVVAVHGVLTLLLARASFESRQTAVAKV
jgi:hypothetical protein